MKIKRKSIMIFSILFFIVLLLSTSVSSYCFLSDKEYASYSVTSSELNSVHTATLNSETVDEYPINLILSF